ncbi:MAG: hypothetical protein GY768_04320 [Planctomycetaceae bacterium]|nr:hypothetical protein [Planctomycetaceae bacterium]
MTFVRLCLVAVALAVLTTATVQAQSKPQEPSKWSIKNFIPKMPQAPSKSKTKSKPSTLTKFNNGTKAFFAKSKALVPSWLMPDTQDRVKQSSKTIKQSATKIDQEIRTARRKSLLPWIKEEPAPEKPATVSDFLALPKPGY